MTKKPTTDELQYARDCIWVWENIGSRLDELRGREDATPSRLVLFEWVGTTEGRETFLKTLLPKSQDALVKARSSRDPDAVVTAETKSIAELRTFIKNVIAEAKAEE